MRQLLYLSFLCVAFMSCEWTIYPPLSQYNEEPSTTENKKKKNWNEVILDCEKIKWNSHLAMGLLLHDSTALFNEDFTFNRYEYFKDPVEVSIIQKSDSMVRVGLYEDFCKRAFILKIAYNGSIYCVRGTQLYEMDSKPIAQLKWKNDEINIETASILRMGASNEEGLTLCDEDFKIVLLRNLSKPSLKVIELLDAEEEEIRTPLNESFFVLYSNAGWLDECVNVKARNDSLIFHIQRGFQEGGEEYNLCVWQEQGILYSKIEDLVNYEFETPWDEP